MTNSNGGSSVEGGAMNADEVKKMEKEIDCSYTDEIVCPHCGYEFSDSWELPMKRDGDNTEIECDECQKKFTVYLSVTYAYSSDKKIKESL